MLKNEQNEIKESGKIFALTMVLTKFLLLAIAGSVIWLAQTVLTESIRLQELTRGFILQ